MSSRLCQNATVYLKDEKKYCSKAVVDECSQLQHGVHQASKMHLLKLPMPRQT